MAPHGSVTPSPMKLELLDPEVVFSKDAPDFVVGAPYEIRYDYPTIIVKDDDPEIRQRLSVLAFLIIGDDLKSRGGMSSFWVSPAAVFRVVNVFTMLGIDSKLEVRKAYEEA